MSYPLIITASVLVLILFLSTFVQMLYLESMRLRMRETPALAHFKEHLARRLDSITERGALTFSLVKHSSLVALGVLFLALFSPNASFWPAMGEAVGLALLTMLTVSYIVPQVLYRKTSARWLNPLVPVLRLMLLVLRPLTSLLGFLQSLAELAEQAKPGDDQATTGENIEALINAGEEEGIIEKEDRKLIQSVVAFGDKTVREVMTARPHIVSIEAGNSLEDLREIVLREQFSRIPVYRGSIDNINGFIHVRDMFELDEEERARKKLVELMRPIKSVPETKNVNDLLRDMQEDGTHMAVVIDEYGNTAGLVTMEDMVEEIVGEIRDEHEPDSDVMKEPDGSYVVSGSYDLDHLYDLLQFRPQNETEATTVGGLVTEWMGRVPGPGECVERDGIRMEVIAANELRVGQVRISRANGATPCDNGSHAQ
jgi:CBS domain containing-hemolysin-like protein